MVKPKLLSEREVRTQAIRVRSAAIKLRGNLGRQSVERAALDGTFYTGGRTSTNGSLDNDLQRNSRWGGTFARTLTRHNSLKLYFSRELAARTGTEFRIYGIAWQYRWGAGL